MLQDYQILQRNEFGYAIAQVSGQLPIDWDNGDRISVCAFRENDNLMIQRWTKAQINDEEWSCNVRLPEGGLYRLEACVHSDDSRCDWSPRIKCVRHIGVGDLYLITGQSNMAGYGKDIAYDPPCLGVHLYANNGKWDIASHPLDDSVDTIYPENKEVKSATSPALSFGRRLKQELGVPIGLIQASLGGSSLAMWHPKEDGSLYQGMMRRLEVIGAVKGVIWYQGCSEAMSGNVEGYLERFSEMVSLWREKLGDIPILTVQLNRRQVHVEEKKARDWGMIKEAQRQAARTLPKVYVVPSHDVPMSDAIHNSSVASVIIGERLALIALQGIYGRTGRKAPDVEWVEYVDATHIRVHFVEDALMACTEICGDGKVEEMQVEDCQGLINVNFAQGNPGELLLTLERSMKLPAKFHALWRSKLSSSIPHDVFGMPMLGCYGVDVCQIRFQINE